MDYKKLYASKLCTAREAVKVVTSGDWIDYGSGSIGPGIGGKNA